MGFLFVLTAFMLGIFAHWAISRGAFDVRQVRIVGARYSDPRDVLSAASSGLEGGVFRDFSDVRFAVERMPIVRRAEVDRVPPDRVVIRIEEREPIAILAGGICRPIDENGWLLPLSPADVGLDLPIIQLAGQQVREAEGRVEIEPVQVALGFLRELRELSPQFLKDISVLSVDEDGSIRLATVRRDIRIHFGAGETTGTLRLLEEVLNDIERKGMTSCHVDLRYDSQVVVH